MIRRYPFLCAALLLSGCMGTGLTSPASVANATKLDEQAGLGITLAYTTASRLGTVLAKADLIDKGRFKVLDARGYEAVLAARAAYQAGSATSYTAAIERAAAAVEAINALVETPREPR